MQPEEKKKEEPVASKEMSGHTPTVTPQIQANIQKMCGKGKQLPSSARNFFEPRFGYDFSQVRVHHDAQAAETAQEVKAKAFTVGKYLVFGRGQYAPETSKGRQLMAHELTHVVQQISGRKNVEIQTKQKSAQNQPSPKPAQTVYAPYKQATYKIEGRTLKEVAQNIEIRDEAGRTECQILVNRTHGTDGKILKVKVIVEMTITMPVWPNYTKQSKAAKAEWDRAYNSLKIHENGHIKIIKERTKNFAALIIGMTDAESDNALTEKIEELKQANDKYNQETDYGRKQGTIIDTTIQ